MKRLLTISTLVLLPVLTLPAFASEMSASREMGSTAATQLCSALAGLEPGSWEYREAAVRCQYGSN